MLEPKTPAPSSEGHDGRIVYRRGGSADATDHPQSDGEKKGSAVGGKLAPTLTTLLVSFIVLLALVLILGLISVRRLNEVSTQVLESQRRHSAWLSLLLQVRNSVTRLNAEARVRADASARGGLSPPLALPLGNARADLTRSLQLLDRPPFTEMDKWRTLRADAQYFLETTRDLDIYSNEGFQQFRKIDAELNDLLTNDMQRDDEDIFQRGEGLQNAAVHNIHLLTLSALVGGALLAAGTMFEVQRRFRQMRRSLEIARRERHYSRQMLEGMVSAVAAIDVRDRLRNGNAAFFDIFPTLKIGASVHDHSLPPNVLRVLESATASRVKSATYRGRWQLEPPTCQSGERTFDLYSSPLDLDGEAGQIITLVDVTDVAKAEAEVRRTEALAAVGQASAQVAHEIKNPLGSIRLGVSMLRDTTKDSESLKTIDLVERGIYHLSKLVIDVTRFSRHKPLELSDVDLRQLIEGSLELVVDLIREKEIRVEKQFNSEEVRGDWDEDQLRQVFVNLLANAVDASSQGGRIILSTERLSTSRNGENIPLARATIRDEGSGMDEPTRAKIFEPFFTTKKRGTGLGLAIVKQIVEQHEGNITIESSQGKGTRFIVNLPARN